VFTGASDPVRTQLGRGGVVEVDGVVAFEPDLDRGLQRCEDGLLYGGVPVGDMVEGEGVDVGAVEGAADGPTSPDGSGDVLAGMPPGLHTYLERVPLPEGTVLIRQNDPSDDVYVLESGRLVVEVVNPEGTRIRLRTIRPGVVVGEVSMYTGVPRTANVVAGTPSVVLRLSEESIEQMEAAEPELAAQVHRWLARTLSERLSDTLRAFDALIN